MYVDMYIYVCMCVCVCVCVDSCLCVEFVAGNAFGLLQTVDPLRSEYVFTYLNIHMYICICETRFGCEL